VAYERVKPAYLFLSLFHFLLPFFFISVKLFSKAHLKTTLKKNLLVAFFQTHLNSKSIRKTTAQVFGCGEQIFFSDLPARAGSLKKIYSKSERLTVG
jgi:hypothetical protein